MSSNKPALVIITNLYPLPWQPNRATFNRQQFDLLHDDYEVSILVPIAIGDWLKHKKQIKQHSNLRFVPYFYLPKIGRRFYSVFMFLSILLHSGLWLKAKKIDTILASWAFPEAVASAWLSKLFSTKFFFKVHGSDINLHSKVPARAKQIVSAGKTASGILSVSQALAQQLIDLGVDATKVNVVYNGVDHDKFSTKNNAPIVGDYLLFIGNLKPDKGVIELFEGFATVAKTHPDLQLVYAGNGAMSAKLRSLSEQHQLQDRVKLLGTVNHQDLPAWISHARLLALPSYNEGVPNVVLESMACGTPILATNVGGIPEIVDENICGYLIPPQNSQAVAEGIDKVLGKLWDKQAIQQHAQQFSWLKNRQQLISMLKTNKS